MKNSEDVTLRETLTILYQEVRNGLRVYRHKRRSLAERKRAEAFVERAINTGKPVKVELAGHVKRKEMADWIVTDIEGKADIAIDLLERFPFPNDSVEHVYSSHVLEHFSYPNQMQHVLQESRRILRTGGIFSIAVPDVRFYVDFYLDQEREMVSKDWRNFGVGLQFNSRVDLLNFVAYLGNEHKHLFDRDNLLKILEEAGYRDVKLRDHDPNLDPEWRLGGDSIYAVGTK